VKVDVRMILRRVFFIERDHLGYLTVGVCGARFIWPLVWLSTYNGLLGHSENMSVVYWRKYTRTMAAEIFLSSSLDSVLRTIKKRR
jgi:hypothetical protein